MKSIYIVNEVSSAAVYGIGTYVEHLVNILKDSCFKVNVIYLYSEDISVPELEVLDNIRYFKISTFRSASTNVLKNKERYYRNVYYFLYPFLKEEKNEIIFHFNFMQGRELALLLKNHFCCKIILTVHYINCCLELLGDIKRLNRALSDTPDKDDFWVKSHVKEEKMFLNDCIDKIIAISVHSTQTLVSLYNIDREKITLVNHGVNDEFQSLNEVDKWAIKRSFGFEKDEKIIVYAGRLDSLKRLDYLIDSFKYVLQEQENVRLVIAGDGNFKKYMKCAAPYWSKIIFTGFLNKKCLYKLYSISILGIVPSYYEEFGYVAAEMMMMGLPVVANKTTGLSEIIDDGVNGVLTPIEEMDNKSFSKLISSLIKDDLRLEEIGRCAREKYIDRFEINIFREKMLNLYNDI